MVKRVQEDLADSDFPRCLIMMTSLNLGSESQVEDSVVSAQDLASINNQEWKELDSDWADLQARPQKPSTESQQRQKKTTVFKEDGTQ